MHTGKKESEIINQEEAHSTKFFKEVFVYHIHGLATGKGILVLEENIPAIDKPVS